jgi:hypothetical protein
LLEASEGKTLVVLNTETGAVDFQLGKTDLTTLDANGFAIFGDYLYVANSSDSPVLDMQTRQRVSAGWKVRPVQWINSTWLVVDHRANSTEHCYEAGREYSCGDSDSNPNDVTLENHPDGKYSGPRY